MLLSSHGHVVVDPEAKKVGKFDHAEHGEAAAESHQPAHVGEEVDKAVEFAALPAHKVEILEEDVKDGQVLAHVAVVLVVRL